ncbi:MAG: hypothetical protein HY360_03265 [Verrucomicrobia bacterium]|nr:hypothetical protein [Verrucomicrobiota bacterium]
MKKILLSGFVLGALMSVAWADIIYPDGRRPYEDLYMKEPFQLKKFSRGLMNVVMAPFEIPKAVFDIGRDQGITDSQQFSLGLITRGPVRTALRFGSGLYDLGTFFEHNKPLLHLEPEYMNIEDVLPGYNYQFDWETLDTPGSRVFELSN